MKLVIFAGGKGTRLWPLSRVNSPKQFDKLFNGKSTIQLAFDRVAPHFGKDNIFVQTVDRYKDSIKEQLPELPEGNILLEPAKRDLGPAVCFTMSELAKRGHNGAVSILWADHLMHRTDEFINALKTSHELINEDPNRFVFLAEKPRFANNNLGWMKAIESEKSKNNFNVCRFEGWKYKPPTEECNKMYESGDYFWNPGYFITSVDFLLDTYKELAPEIYKKVTGGDYENAEALHFDQAIIEKTDLDKAVVLKTDMGWSDPGTLYALKEALEENNKSNVKRGKVSELNCEDSLIYNLEDNKLVTAVGVKGMVIVNTPDSLVVVPKDEVVHITKLVKKIEEEGHLEHL